MAVGLCTVLLAYALSLKSIENPLTFGENKVENPCPIALNAISEIAQPPPTTDPLMPSLPITQSGSDLGGLSVALEAAVQIHIQRAQAERRVASEYAFAILVRAHCV